MPSQERRSLCYLPTRPLIGLALLYLMLPNILFLSGWIRWQIALPCIMLLIAGGTVTWRRIPASATVAIRRHDILALLAGLLLCVATVDASGITGHTLQSGDFLVRTAIYDTLVRCDWPLFDNQGRYFVYYAAFWLPPALASKLAGTAISPYILLQLWVTAGVMLAFLCLFCRWRSRAFLVLLIALALGSLYDVTRYFQYLGHWLQTHPDTWRGYILPKKLSCWLSPHALYFNMNYFSLWRALSTYTFHCTTPALLLFSLLSSRLLPWRYILFACALIPLTSPLETVALLPLLTLTLLPRLKRQGKELLTDATWCVLPLLACVACYMMCSDNSAIRLLWQDSPLYSPRPLTYRLLKYALILPCCALPAFYFLWPRYRRLTLFRSAVALMVFLPVVWIGANNNELLFKGSAVMYLSLAPLYVSALYHGKGWRRWLLVGYLVLFSTNMSSDIIMRVIPHYSWNADKMADNIDTRWQGHLNHPEEQHLTEQFFTTAPLPRLLYWQAGGSAATLLSFAATGHLSTQDTPPPPGTPPASAVTRK